MEIVSFSLPRQRYFPLNVEMYTGKHWFALKVFYNKVFEVEDLLKKDRVETYIPCEEVLMERNGVKRKVRRPVLIRLCSSVPLSAMLWRYSGSSQIR